MTPDDFDTKTNDSKTGKITLDTSELNLFNNGGFALPQRPPQSYFTRRRITKAKRKSRRKMQQASRRKNRK